jgi:uncharacterized protein YjbI with pentapeptide repeats
MANKLNIGYWDRCEAETEGEKCTGARLGSDGRCFAHTQDRKKRGDVLARFHRGEPLDFTLGLPITGQLLDQILEAAPRGEARRPILRNANFLGATFKEGAVFAGIDFRGLTVFAEADFHDSASFNDAHFVGEEASFGGAEFRMGAAFSGVTFEDGSEFRSAQFSQRAEFYGVEFRGLTYFDGATFDDARFEAGTKFGEYTSFQETHFGTYTSFYLTKFGDEAWFRGTVFGEYTSFKNVTFEEVNFEGSQFGGDTDFVATSFGLPLRLGPLIVKGQLALDRSIFAQKSVIEVVSSQVSCVSAKFQGPVTMRVRFADIALDGSEFTQPSAIVFASAPFKSFDLTDLFDEAHWNPKGSRPRLISLRQIDVSKLDISELDLRMCIFDGVLHLDSLGIEGTPSFAHPPGVAKENVLGLQLPVWRWTHRQVLAEEQHWRADQSAIATQDEAPSGLGEKPATKRRTGWKNVRGWISRQKRAGWHSVEQAPYVWLRERSGLQPRQLDADLLASLYRQLRKSQEDSGNEPGAADFYYGEMEMRRASPSAPRGERFILTLYWLVSGYGLRASRALLSWLITIAVFSFLLWWFGFGARPPFVWALLFSAESTSSLFRIPETQSFSLNYAGEALQIPLRLLGPLFFGLVLLSIRGRVKR